MSTQPGPGIGATALIRVPATSANLGPGFDCLALALGLHNSLQLRVMPGQAHGSIEITGEGQGTLSREKDNLAVIAMQKLADIVGLALPCFSLRMHNLIPLGRGLGSSAAAIASGLLGGAFLLGLDHDPELMTRVGLELEGHPDNIVAALTGGLTIGVIHGGAAITYQVRLPSALKAIVLVPDQFSSTNESRAALPDTVTRTDAVFNAGRTALLVAALADNRLDLLRVAMDDHLHQGHRAAVFPYLDAVIGAAVGAGAHGASLSGAGSSVIALATEGHEGIAAAMLAAAREHCLAARTLILDPDPYGATRENLTDRELPSLIL